MENKRRKYTVIGVTLLVTIGAAALFISRRSSAQTTSSSSVMSAQTAKATATAEVNRAFVFEAINQSREYKEVSYTITQIERKDEIRVKGELKRAPRDYDYLLVRIEIENTHPERLALSPSDMIRLEDSRGKLFSPDFHNGNVILDPISVKNDLMSFTVSKDTKNFVFQIGSLEGEKEKVEVNF